MTYKTLMAASLAATLAMVTGAHAQEQAKETEGEPQNGIVATQLGGASFIPLAVIGATVTALIIRGDAVTRTSE